MTLTGEILEMGDLPDADGWPNGVFGIRIRVGDLNRVVTISGLNREEVVSLAPLLFLDVVVTVEGKA